MSLRHDERSTVSVATEGFNHCVRFIQSAIATDIFHLHHRLSFFMTIWKARLEEPSHSGIRWGRTSPVGSSCRSVHIGMSGFAIELPDLSSVTTTSIPLCPFAAVVPGWDYGCVKYSDLTCQRLFERTRGFPNHLDELGPTARVFKIQPKQQNAKASIIIINYQSSNHCFQLIMKFCRSKSQISEFGLPPPCQTSVALRTRSSVLACCASSKRFMIYIMASGWPHVIHGIDIWGVKSGEVWWKRRATGFLEDFSKRFLEFFIESDEHDWKF